MILVDTSIWIDHLCAGLDELAFLLEHAGIIIHPLIIGELACGNLKNRRELLRLWHDLPQAPTVTHDETLFFIEQHKLMGQGIGYIDIQLLASTMLADKTLLWTGDKRLAKIARNLGIAYHAKIKK